MDWCNEDLGSRGEIAEVEKWHEDYLQAVADEGLGVMTGGALAAE